MLQLSNMICLRIRTTNLNEIISLALNIYFFIAHQVVGIDRGDKQGEAKGLIPIISTPGCN